MTLRWSLPCLVLFSTLAAGSALGAPRTTRARITGSATYRERIALPRGATFVATLEEATRNAIPGQVIGEARTRRLRQVPIPFVIQYDRTRIESRLGYLVRATVRDRRGRILFTGTKTFSAAELRHAVGIRVLMRRSGSEGHASGQRGESGERRGSGERSTQRREAGERHASGGQQGRGGAAVVGLLHTRWRLVRVGDDEIAVRDPQKVPWLELDGNSTRVSGYLGCNGVAGTFVNDDRSLRFRDLISTQMACDYLDVENGFKGALDGTRQYRVRGSTLELLDDRGHVLATLEAVPSR